VEREGRVNDQPYDGKTALGIACANGAEAIAATLLNNGGFVDALDAEGSSPLVGASQYGHVAVVRLLIERGASKDLVNSVGLSPLAYAATNGYSVVVKELLEAGAKVNEQLLGGETALSGACKAGDMEAARVLIKFGWRFFSRVRFGFPRVAS